MNPTAPIARLFQQVWFLFTLMMLLLTLVVAKPARAEDTANLTHVRSVTASGTAERKVALDEAHVSVTIGATSMKLAEAKAAHDRKLRDVVAIAKKEEINEAQIKTQSSSTQPQYTWENNKQNFKGYRVATTLGITVKEIGAVGALLEKLSAAGLEQDNKPEWGQLISVSYSISNPDKIRDEMLADAIKNARAKAENMAAAAGASLGNVLQINESGTPQFAPIPMPMMARAMVASDGAMAEKSVAPPVGEQSLNANVTVTFELK